MGAVNLPRHRAKRPLWIFTREGRKSLFSMLAITAIAAFVALPLVSPSMSDANAWFFPDAQRGEGVVVMGAGFGLERQQFGVTGGWGTAPAVGRPDPGTAQAIALEMMIQRGWNQGEFGCLVALWAKESGWNHHAMNKSSGAYGIPQALPGNKMASAGEDWATNPATQISWGLGYIEARYGTPCAAWSHSQQKNWY